MKKLIGPPSIKIRLDIPMPTANPVPDLIADTCDECGEVHDKDDPCEEHSNNMTSEPLSEKAKAIPSDYYNKSMEQDKINNKRYVKGLL